MKKILKVLFGILLVLGCSCGVFLDNSGMFVKSAWANEHKWAAKWGDEKIEGTEVLGMKCITSQAGYSGNYDKTVGVKTDKGTYVGHYNGSTDCQTLLENLIKHLEASPANFKIDFTTREPKTSGNNFTYVVGDVAVTVEYQSSAEAQAEAEGRNTGGGSNPGGGSNSGGGEPEITTETYEGGGAPEMVILKMCQNTSGSGTITCVLNLVVNIMTYGIGVLGVVGIVLSGIQYITSQGDPAKMTKAKNRIIQVVIGLVIYAVMYSALVFLVPGFSTDIMGG
ncbi:hypothetical protein IKG45_03655 [Candidatus Saccharibacteria bacterium]|nr:hypothetical protein [Candidatus Saccharibacteria bacterium]